MVVHYGKTPSRSPQSGPSWDQPKILNGMEVLHAPASHDIQMDRLLWVPTVRPNLYERLLLFLMLQPGLPRLPSIQGKAEGKYFFRSHRQCGQKQCGVHQGHPVSMSKLIPPRQVGVLVCHTNQLCVWDRSMEQLHSRGPSNHCDHHPWKHYNNGHQERKVKFKLHTTNGHSWRRI